MKLFKRTFASLGLVALLAVSGTALADENDDIVTASDVTATDVTADPTVDPADDTSDSDSGSDDPLPTFCAARPAESIDIVGENFEFHSGITDADDVDQDELFKGFAADTIAGYDEFADALKSFNDPEVDLSTIHDLQKVTVMHTWGGTCTGNDWAGHVALAVSVYEFDVAFPTTGVIPPVFLMPIVFDGNYLALSFVPLTYDSDPNFDRLVALNGKEMSVDEFLAVMGEIGASTEDFPKVGEVYGKHTVTFADYEDTWSIVTVVYPEKGDGGQVTPTPPTPIVPQQPNPPVDNSQAGNSGNVRASDMSYRQFRGNDANLTPIAPAPVQPTPESKPTTTGGDTTNGQKTTEPKLPKTGSDDDAAALVTDGSSRSALIGLAACVGFGIVAAVSVIGVRRFMKSGS